MRHTATKINRALGNTEILWWDDYLLKQIFTWAGHVGRMSVYDPHRLALKTLQHRGRRYLLSLREQFGQECHGRRFHVWRWEKMFYGYFGDDCIQSTLNSDNWYENFHGWLQWKRRSIRYSAFKHKETYKWMNFGDSSSGVTDSSSSSSSSSSRS